MNDVMQHKGDKFQDGVLKVFDFLLNLIVFHSFFFFKDLWCFKQTYLINCRIEILFYIMINLLYSSHRFVKITICQNNAFHIVQCVAYSVTIFPFFCFIFV